MIQQRWNAQVQQAWSDKLLPLGRLILGPSSGKPGTHVTNQQSPGSDPIVYQKGSAQNAFYADPPLLQQLSDGFARVVQASAAAAKFAPLPAAWTKALGSAFGAEDD
jgi:hypothetical protein